MTAEIDRGPAAAAGAGAVLLPSAVAATGLFVASLVAMGRLAPGPFPTPFDPPSMVVDYFRGGVEGTRWQASFQFAAAVPLAVFAGGLAARLRDLGVRTAGPAIALAGGIAASIFLMIAAMMEFMLARPAVLGDPGLIHAFHDLAHLAGGPGHVVMLGLLLAGASASSSSRGLLPRGVAILGLVTAAASILSALRLATPYASFFLLSRFPAFAWMIAAAICLPHSVPVSDIRGAIARTPAD